MKVDLHVHSRFSDRPSDWFLQRIGTAESYTDPEDVYRSAMSRGMDLVTITDHNRMAGSLYLKELCPEQVVTGVETTAYFPEDGCKIHFLVYGLTEGEFEMIERLRRDVYELRDFVKERRLAHSVAHATFSVNGRLHLHHLERLILLFDVFEGINGARNERNNRNWMSLLRSLTPEDIDRLYAKHRIEPFSDDAWIKGLTAGSDDHGGLFIGRTYTRCEADNVEGLLERLRSKETSPGGQHNDYQGLTFSIYRIAYQFARKKSKAVDRTTLGQITRYVFEKKRLGLTDRIRIRFLRSKKNGGVHHTIGELIKNIERGDPSRMDGNLDLVYTQITKIADRLLVDLFRSIEKNLKSGSVTDLLKDIASAIPGVFLSVPFLTSFQYMFRSRTIESELLCGFQKEDLRMETRILCFTDDPALLEPYRGLLAGVTVATIGPAGGDADPGAHSLLLPGIHTLTLPSHKKLSIRIPSFLSALKMVYEFDPDRIMIATAGPAGLLGLFLSKLLSVPCRGLYTEWLDRLKPERSADEDAVALLNGFASWFYGQLTEVTVESAGADGNGSGLRDPNDNSNLVLR